VLAQAFFQMMGALHLLPKACQHHDQNTQRDKAKSPPGKTPMKAAVTPITALIQQQPTIIIGQKIYYFNIPLSSVR